MPGFGAPMQGMNAAQPQMANPAGPIGGGGDPRQALMMMLSQLFAQRPQGGGMQGMPGMGGSPQGAPAPMGGGGPMPRPPMPMMGRPAQPGGMQGPMRPPMQGGGGSFSQPAGPGMGGMGGGMQGGPSMPNGMEFASLGNMLQALRSSGMGGAPGGGMPRPMG